MISLDTALLGLVVLLNSATLFAVLRRKPTSPEPTTRRSLSTSSPRTNTLSRVRHPDAGWVLENPAGEVVWPADGETCYDRQAVSMEKLRRRAEGEAVEMVTRV